MKQRYFRHLLVITVAVAAVLCVFATNDRFGRKTARADQPSMSLTDSAHAAPKTHAIPASMTVAYAAARPAIVNASWEALMNASWR